MSLGCGGWRENTDDEVIAAQSCSAHEEEAIFPK
jgi:hypothetical protein